MKSFRSILTNLALLPINGCIFPGHRDTADDMQPLRSFPPKANLAGVGGGKSPAGRIHAKIR
ncbi:MAG: hypothetical protein P4N60_05915 [Verrucomicrobiae bacterium]|nr:hypothetical protein [Verrucomicrobiae bacterium]